LGYYHSLIWGLGYRNTKNVIVGNFYANFDPPVRSFGMISYFVQDEITLREDLLRLILGSKFEHNGFSGFECQPTARLLFTPNNRQTAWASISRAVRIPSRVDQDMRMLSGPIWTTPGPVPPPMAGFLRLQGNPEFRSEELLSFEIGYREQTTDVFWWDVAAFYNDYDHLLARVAGAPEAPPPGFNVFYPLVNFNAMRGETYGFELAATYEVNPCWRLRGGYSLLKMALHASAEASSTAEDDEGESPRNQAFLQSGWDFGQGLEVDMIWRYVDSLPTRQIPSYLVMDVRLA
jgi:iron complex outermembrane receptor protein